MRLVKPTRGFSIVLKYFVSLICAIAIRGDFGSLHPVLVAVVSLVGSR